jgi:hypothetical protein
MICTNYKVRIVTKYVDYHIANLQIATEAASVWTALIGRTILSLTILGFT